MRLRWFLIGAATGVTGFITIAAILLSSISTAI